MMASGVFALPWWGLVLATLILTHVTIASVTIFLHRHQAHRALDLHPAVSHFFRFWLWLTTGMVTREWVAIHRKHHAKCETADDPHSPQVYGITKVLLEGAELYGKEATNRETLATYGRGTPDDWIERHLYTPHTVLGISLMLIIDLALFGIIGLTVWAVQMLWIPIFAAGVVNGIGHYLGYRSFVTRDASKNIVPWGLLIGGEELHNNHHAYSNSAKLSSRWWEFDIGWMYIRLLAMLKLAHVNKVAARLRFDTSKASCDLETLQAILTHRYAVLAGFTRSLRRTVKHEATTLNVAHLSATVKRWLQRDAESLPEKDHAVLRQALMSSTVLQTVYSMRQELVSLIARTNETREQLLQQLEDWCRRAEESGIAALQDFSRQLRSYA
jgi:stearoyl-CoA desaturase (delta-9 desaturase)